VTARLVPVRRVVAAWSALWVLVRFPYLRALADLPEHRWEPVGLLAPLPHPPPDLLVTAALAGAAGLGALVALDRAPRPAVVGWSVLVLGVTTWASCWGQLFHTENLLALHALLLGAAALVARPDPAFVVRAMAVVTVVAYVVAGAAKLRGSGLEWLTGDVLRDQVAFDSARKAVVGGATSPLGTRLVEYERIWPPLAAASLAVELGAPVALLHRRLAHGWVAAAWLFHVGVLALMAIGFPYQLSLVAFAPLLPLERVRWLVPAPVTGAARHERAPTAPCRRQRGHPRAAHRGAAP
jgi:hypothetical protein